ncbi:MAG: GspH/FimT family pseudopilin [Rubrivivax sp.]|jgi:type IV fimbrial biogenesis protein FimT|nr:GspH/FimT family pseudopilin [Rubrivivax sp.]
MRGAATASRGLTLVELAIVLALVGVLATLALPGLAAQLDRHRLRAAAEGLALDLGEARHEAARQGRALHFRARSGPGWCYAITTSPGCGCDAPACALKTVHAADFPGIDLAAADALHLTPDGLAQRGGALLRNGRGETLRVVLAPLGRATVCAPGRSDRGVPPC